MNNATKTHEFYRAGYQRSDCNVVVGKIFANKKLGLLIVTEVDAPIDTDEGQKPWSQRYICRQCTRDEQQAAAKATRVAQLKRQLAALTPAADDDRDHDRRAADRERVIAELATME